jgi:hypothetical protein
VDDGAPDVPPPYADEALGLEDPKGLPDRGWAHLEIGEEIFLTGKGVTFLQAATEDLVA